MTSFRRLLAVFVLPALLAATLSCQRKAEDPPGPPAVSHGPPQGARITAESNGELSAGYYDFSFEDLSHPDLAALREREKLDEVTAGGATELDKFRLLRTWVNERWKSDVPRPYPPWNALTILDMARSGRSRGFCAQYAVVMCQACLSMGRQCRYIELAPGGEGAGMGHFISEVWSNELDKWVVMDPFLDCELRRDGEPLSALEVHMALASGEADEIEVVRGPGENRLDNSNRFGDDIVRLYHHLAMDMRVDHLSRPLPFWDRRFGYLSWRDEITDGRPGIFGRTTSDPAEFDFPLNQVNLVVSSDGRPGKAVCLVRHNTPGFEALEVNIDGRGWAALPPPLESYDRPASPLRVWLSPELGGVMSFRWALTPGKNRIAFRARNELGVTGPASSFELGYDPGSIKEVLD